MQAFGGSLKLSSSGSAMYNPIVQNLKLHIKNFLLSKGSVLVLCNNLMYRPGLVDMLVTHALRGLVIIEMIWPCLEFALALCLLS